MFRGHTGASFVAAVLVISATSCSPRALAQMAPVDGSHYATGSSAASTASGGFSASVPLDFSPVDASVPVPIGVVYNGGKRVGAAGLGWDVPLSYVYHGRYELYL